MPTSARKRGSLRRTLSLVATVIAIIAGVYVLELAIPKHDYFIERRGTLAAVDADESDERGGIGQTVRLTSTTGLQVDLRTLRPQVGPGETLPVLIVAGGARTGKDAVDLVGVPQNVAYVAIDYPYHGNQELDAFWESVSAVPAIQQAFLDTPPALSLAADWVLQQPWADANNVELVGASLGVPFVAVAGALDERFSRVWLLHGGADNVSWVKHVGREYVENEFLRGGVARGALLLVYGNSFDTGKWIEEIAPRPLVVVAARDDDFVPPEAQQPFIDAAASEYIEIVWTEGMHIRPNRENELQQLLDVVLSRIDGAGSKLR